MQDSWFWLISNPALIFYLMAFLIVFFRLWGRGELGNVRARADITLAYFLLIAVGVEEIYQACVYAFYGQSMADYLGFAASPFQIEVAFAHAALGVLGILCFRANFGFRLATVISLAIFGLGAAFAQAVASQFDALFYMDILTPLTAIILMAQYHKHAKGQHALGQDKYI